MRLFFKTYLEDLSHEYTPEICVHLLKALDRLVTLNFDDNHKVEKENRNERLQFPHVLNFVFYHLFSKPKFVYRNVVTTSMASATTLQW